MKKQAGGQVALTDLTVSPTVELGGHLDLSVTLRTDLQADVIVDDALRFAAPANARADERSTSSGA